MRLVTILGGTGVFGRRIAGDLATFSNTRVRIVARDRADAEALGNQLGGEFCAADITQPNEVRRAIQGSAIVIHAAGPFQTRDYRVANACIDMGCHYIDLADAREFVCGIGVCDARAKARGVFVTSGASSVPAITHALISELQSQFGAIGEIEIALSPGNQNPRGAATIAAILSYLGRPIRTWQGGKWVERRGWRDTQWLRFAPPVGLRRVHNCDVPDVELFPAIFNAQSVRFRAGVELNLINYTLSALAMLRSIVPMRNLPNVAPMFLRGTLLLYRFGSRNGSLSVWVRGSDHDGKLIERRIAIVTDDDGPATPCSPSIILGKKILQNGPPRIGAFHCMGFISLDEIETHLRRFGVWIARGDEYGWYDPAPNGR